MNIFVLDTNHFDNALYHCDKHVVKMPLETAQLLCSARHVLGCTSQISYKITHKNHPCSIWCRSSYENYFWLAELGIALCEEYQYRYGKTHKCLQVISECIYDAPKFEQYQLTPFAQAMPEVYKCDNAVNAYRYYYIAEKQPLFKWTSRPIPHWIPMSCFTTTPMETAHA